MSRFLESIAIIDGEIPRLAWHQRRVDQTLGKFYPGASINLEVALSARPRGDRGTVKCRVTYDRDVCGIEFSPYEARKVETLRLIQNNEIDYSFKFTDRRAIQSAFGERGSCDDILIVKRGMITDTSIANVVFRRNDMWFTPRQPLLKGTMRQYLLDRGALVERDIALTDLPLYSAYKLVNALLGFPSKEYPVSNIQF